MIPNSKVREVDSGGVTASAGFGISLKDSAHIMTILRDTLYSDKVLAVLREYSANAWDAHREVGKYDVPIEVTLPTETNPTLAIRDFGPGLSHDDVFLVFTQYGASTKRGNNGAVGMLGIGSKSGFAYSDSFTITSWNGGKKRIYAAVLDESDKGTINLLHEEDCDEETGVLIEIAIRRNDINEFHEKALNLFQYFSPRPVINLDLPPEPPDRLALQNGIIYDAGKARHLNDDQRWVAVMGCIPYRLNLDQLKGPDGEYMFSKYVRKVAGVLYFDVGDIQFNASREELKYNENTRKKIVEKFDKLVDEYVLLSLTMIESGGYSLWEKRLRARGLKDLGLPLPEAWKNIAEDHLKWDDLPQSFLFGKNGPSQHLSLSVSADTRFIIKDDDRKIDGYHFSYHDIVCRPADGQTVEEAKAELEAMIAKLYIVGVPIIMTSSLPWTNPTKAKPKKMSSEKHKVRTFVLKTGDYYRHPWSRNWDVVHRAPSPDDVFVILDKFQEMGNKEFFSEVDDDEKLLEHFGKPLPPIYGYKNTKKKPLTKDMLVGTHYAAWRVQMAKELLTPEINQQLELSAWSETISGQWKGWNKKEWFNGIKRAIEVLGKKHPISILLRTQKTAQAKFERVDRDRQRALEDLVTRLGLDKSASPANEINNLMTVYPLLALDGNDVDLVIKGSQKWFDYIKTIDNYNKLVAMVRDGE